VGQLVRWRKLLIIALLIALLPVSGMGYLWYRFVMIPRAEIAAFCEKTSDDKILGKTPDEVLTTFGRAWGDTVNSKNWPHPERQRVIAYSGPYGMICRIEFADGLATKVQHYSR
jgi:hypothetical protein